MMRHPPQFEAPILENLIRGRFRNPIMRLFIRDYGPFANCLTLLQRTMR